MLNHSSREIGLDCWNCRQGERTVCRSIDAWNKRNNLPLL